MIFIDDVVEALMTILSRPIEPGARYLLNDPAVPDVETMVRLAMNALGLEAPIRRVPEALALTAAFLAETWARLTCSPPLLTSYAVKAMGHRCYFSLEGTSRKLGWSPRTKAADAIAKTVAWFRGDSSMSPAPPPGPGAPRRPASRISDSSQECRTR
jgi:nucleoside-diphosphate-sugar epimerase